MANISTDNFMVAMVEKWMYNMDNHSSEFNKRVVVKEAYRVFVKDGVDEEGNDTYNFSWKGIVFDPADNSVVVEAEIHTTGQKGLDELSTERIESIMTAALSGIYSTPYDARNVHKAFGHNYKCECDECGEAFGDDLDKFVEHLKATGHKDEIFKKYPYWTI